MVAQVFAPPIFGIAPSVEQIRRKISQEDQENSKIDINKGTNSLSTRDFHEIMNTSDAESIRGDSYNYSAQALVSNSLVEWADQQAKNIKNNSNQMHGTNNDYSKFSAASSEKDSRPIIVKVPSETPAYNNMEKISQTLDARAMPNPRLEATVAAAMSQAKIHYTDDKGYSSRSTLNAFVVANTPGLDGMSMGYIGSIRSNSRDGLNTNLEHTPYKRSDIEGLRMKISNPLKTEVHLRSEDIAELQKIRDEFSAALKAKYPKISVPVLHPELGYVHIEMKFGPMGTLNAQFFAHNPEFLKMLNQYRDEFLKVIRKGNYSIKQEDLVFRMQTIKV